MNGCFAVVSGHPVVGFLDPTYWTEFCRHRMRVGVSALIHPPGRRFRQCVDAIVVAVAMLGLLGICAGSTSAASGRPHLQRIKSRLPSGPHNKLNFARLLCDGLSSGITCHLHC